MKTSPNSSVQELFDDFPVRIRAGGREFKGYFDGLDGHLSSHKTEFAQMVSFVTAPSLDFKGLEQGEKISVEENGLWRDFSIEEFNSHGIGVTTVELGIWNKEASFETT